MRAWLRRRRLRRLLKFYGIPKDDDDIRIERIDWCIIGGLLCIFRGLQTEALIDGTLALGLFGNEYDFKDSKNEQRLQEKDPDRATQTLARLQEGMVSVFDHALLKPDPTRHDMKALAANPAIGAELYGRILAHSVGKKKRRSIFTRTSA